MGHVRGNVIYFYRIVWCFTDCGRLQNVISVLTVNTANEGKRSIDIVTPESTPEKKGKTSGLSFMSNLKSVMASGNVTYNKVQMDDKKFEFHYHFTEPVTQDDGGHKVCLMMHGFVSKVKGNDMFIFKPHMIKKTFELMSALGGIVLDDKYATQVIENMRIVGSRRKFPGESNNMTVKTDKQNRYDALVLCGVFNLMCDHRATNAELKQEMMSIVAAVHGIIGHEDFHEQYKAGAYVDQAYPGANLQQVIEDLKIFAEAGRDIDFLINDKAADVKMAYCIMQDKDGKIKNFHSFEKRVFFNVALDAVLVDEHINRIVPRLIGIYSEKFAHVLMRSPGNRSRGWITANI